MPTSVVRVTPTQLRARFNAGNYVGRAAAGELGVQVLNEHRTSRKSGQPRGTRSQIVGYFDRQTGDLLALAHQYRRPDGSIGGSGNPDPKLVREGGIIYSL
jgi:hypothetical protein